MLAKELQEKVRVCCETAEAYKKHSRLYIEKAQTGQENLLKPIIDRVKITIKDKREAPGAKFRSLLLLKEIMDKENRAVQAYVEKKILKRLKDFAKKANENEGKNVFGAKSSDPGAASEFSQLLLECFAEWAVKYAQSSPNSLLPTKFKQFHGELLKSRVKFPQKHTFFERKAQEPPKKPEKPAEKPEKLFEKPEKPAKKPEKSEKTRDEESKTFEKKPSFSRKPENIAKKGAVSAKDIENILIEVKSTVEFLPQAEIEVLEDVMPTLKKCEKSLSAALSPENLEELSLPEQLFDSLLVFHDVCANLCSIFEEVKKNRVPVQEFKSIALIKLQEIEENLRKDARSPQKPAKIAEKTQKTRSNGEGLQGNGAGFQFQGNSAGFQGNSAGFQGNSAGFQGNSAGFQGNSGGFQGNSADVFQGNKADVFQGNSADVFQRNSADVFQGNRADVFQGNSADVFQVNNDIFQGNNAGFQGKNDAFQVNSAGFQGNNDVFQGNNEVFQVQGNNEVFQGNNDIFQGNSAAFQGKNDVFQVNSAGFQENSGVFQGNNDVFHGNSAGFPGNNDVFQGNPFEKNENSANSRDFQGDFSQQHDFFSDFSQKPAKQQENPANSAKLWKKAEKSMETSTRSVTKPENFTNFADFSAKGFNYQEDFSKKPASSQKNLDIPENFPQNRDFPQKNVDFSENFPQNGDFPEKNVDFSENFPQNHDFSQKNVDFSENFPQNHDFPQNKKRVSGYFSEENLQQGSGFMNFQDFNFEIANNPQNHSFQDSENPFKSPKGDTELQNPFDFTYEDEKNAIFKENPQKNAQFEESSQGNRFVAEKPFEEEAENLRFSQRNAEKLRNVENSFEKNAANSHLREENQWFQASPQFFKGGPGDFFEVSKENHNNFGENQGFPQSEFGRNLFGNSENYAQNQENQQDFFENRSNLPQNQENPADLLENRSNFEANQADLLENRYNFPQNQENPADLFENRSNQADFFENRSNFPQNQENPSSGLFENRSNQADFFENRYNFPQNQENPSSNLFENRSNLVANQADFFENRSNFLQNQENQQAPSENLTNFSQPQGNPAIFFENPALISANVLQIPAVSQKNLSISQESNKIPREVSQNAQNLMNFSQKSSKTHDFPENPANFVIKYPSLPGFSAKPDKLSEIFAENPQNLVKPVVSQRNLLDFDETPAKTVEKSSNLLDFSTTIPAKLQENAGYQYPTLNPADFSQKTQAEPDFFAIDALKTQNSAKNLEFSQEKPAETAQKHQQLYNLLDSLREKPGNSAKNLVNESFVQQNLTNLSNFRNNSANFADNSQENLEKNPVFQAISREKQDLLQEMQTLKQNFKELRENFEKTQQNTQKTAKTSLIETAFAEFSAKTRDDSAENVALQKKVEQLTQEVQKLKESLSISPEKSAKRAENPEFSAKSLRTPEKDAENEDKPENFAGFYANPYEYTTIFRKKYGRNAGFIANSVNFYTISLRNPYNNAFLQEKQPNSLKTSRFLVNSAKKPQFSADRRAISSEKGVLVASNYSFLRAVLENTRNCENVAEIDDFKFCCINSKGLLFEDEVYQVGVTSLADFSSKTAKMQLFFGNKSEFPLENCEFRLKTVGSQETPRILQGTARRVREKSQEIVEIEFDFAILQRFQVEFYYNFQGNEQFDAFPLPCTVASFLSFSFASQSLLREKFSQVSKNRVFCNETVHCNPRFVEDLSDFKRFFPEMVELESRKLRRGAKNCRKLAGLLRIAEEGEFLLRIRMDFQRKVGFQLAILEDFKGKARETAELCVQTLCFLFGNI